MAGVTQSWKRMPSRGRIVVASAVALVLVLIVVLLLSRNTRASTGPLRQDDSLRVAEVENTWQVERPKLRRCLVVSYRGELAGNARATWGLSGPVTVWENMRIRATRLRVEARKLTENGECERRAIMQKVRFTLLQKTEDGWRSVPGKRSSMGGGTYGHSLDDAFPGALRGGSYDRGEPYRTTLAMSVEPHWHRHGTSISDSFQVEHTVELPDD